MPRAAIPTSGSLERHSVPAILKSLLAGGRDGCLTVTRGGVTRRLFLRGGMIVYGTSTERQDRLGEILIAQGKLSREDHKHYWHVSRAEGRRLGNTLVVNGRITPHDLYQGVTAQVVTILERLQKWRKGDYLFEAGLPPEPGTALLCIPLALFLRGESGKAAKAAGGGKKAAKKAAPAKARAARRDRAAEPAASGGGAREEQETGEEEISISIPEGEEEISIPEGEEEIRVPTPEEAAQADRVGEVSFLVQELRAREGQGPRAVLGVPEGAGKPEVKEAFRRLARVLDPERLPERAPEGLARDAAEALQMVTAAVDAAEAEVAAAGAAPPAPARAQEQDRQRPPEEQARRHFAQGREFVLRGNFWQAADALRQAVRLSPDEPLYRQYLALSLMQMKRHREAEEHLNMAIRLEPSNAAHWVNLGRIYRSGRLYGKARQAFERALRLDPRDEHAREELRDLPEEAPGQRPGGGSLFKKLFGKG